MAEYAWVGTSGGCSEIRGGPGIVGSGSSSCRRPSPLVTTTPRFTSDTPSRRLCLVEFGSRAIAVKLTGGARARGHSLPDGKASVGPAAAATTVSTGGFSRRVQCPTSSRRERQILAPTLDVPRPAHPERPRQRRLVFVRIAAPLEFVPRSTAGRTTTWARTGRGADRLNQPTVSRETNGEALTWGSGRARIGIVIRRTGETG